MLRVGRGFRKRGCWRWARLVWLRNGLIYLN